MPTIHPDAQPLLDLPHLVDDIAASYDRKCTPDSLAAVELTDHEAKPFVEAAHGQGGQQVLFVSADHILGIGRCLFLPELSFAPWTGARAVLESCSLACWLLDTGITRMERLTRSLNVRLDEQRQQVRFARRKTDQSENELRRETEGIASRITHLREVARKLRIPENRAKNGNFRDFGSETPSISARISSTLGAAADYSLLSFAAHGMFTGTINLSVSLHYSGSEINAKPDLSPQNRTYLIGSVVGWYYKAACSYLDLHGWKRDRLDCQIEEWGYPGLVHRERG